MRFAGFVRVSEAVYISFEGLCLRSYYGSFFRAVDCLMQKVLESRAAGGWGTAPEGLWAESLGDRDFISGTYTFLLVGYHGEPKVNFFHNISII